MVSERLPLFPLRTVLVPGLVLPLTIFEPRYVALVEHLLSLPEEQRAFGVVALRHGRDAGSRPGAVDLHEVGCTAVVRDVSEPDGPGDGRYELITSGAVRFRLDGVDESAGTPYLTGLVSPVPERAGADPERLADLATSTAAAWTAYRVQLGIATTGVPGGVPEDPAVLSYLVMAGMVLDLPERQRLLELPDTASRLREERAILRREQVLISELRSLPAQELLDDPPVYN
ncbi:peptidase S16 [Quadrisphaera setariae]|uniref:Peptidase S16 n=1 Tax=Quadrisphaera setariae TaxID=2593304 RepID=A0A5C8ZF32_9ACTN|nr:peptidase S16 [Quadrisphaera setariae]